MDWRGGVYQFWEYAIILNEVIRSTANTLALVRSYLGVIVFTSLFTSLPGHVNSIELDSVTDVPRLVMFVGHS